MKNFVSITIALVATFSLSACSQTQSTTGQAETTSVIDSTGWNCNMLEESAFCSVLTYQGASTDSEDSEDGPFAHMQLVCPINELSATVGFNAGPSFMNYEGTEYLWDPALYPTISISIDGEAAREYSYTTQNENGLVFPETMFITPQFMREISAANQIVITATDSIGVVHEFGFVISDSVAAVATINGWGISCNGI